jgi:hypothetical protein
MPLHKNQPALGEVRTRDWVAVMAMQGMVANPKIVEELDLSCPDNQAAIAKAAYEMADEILKQSAQELSE